jgi:hypothetical protein
VGFDFCAKYSIIYMVDSNNASRQQDRLGGKHPSITQPARHQGGAGFIAHRGSILALLDGIALYLFEERWLIHKLVGNVGITELTKEELPLSLPTLTVFTRSRSVSRAPEG